MAHRLIKGYAWYLYPDEFGLDDGAAADPGHPFGSGSGEVRAPAEVLFFRPIVPADTGLANERRDHSYLVMTKTLLHPMMAKGWDAAPAALTEKFKTQDGKVRMVRVVELHHRRHGDIMECEIKVDD
jgi:hypothetical protein